MTTVKNGSKWQGSNGKEFYVINTVELEGHKWVHYKSFTEEKEYSCYEESFLVRFTPLLD